MLQAAHFSLVGMRGQRGRKEKGKMGWWQGFAKLSGGQSKRADSVEQKQVIWMQPKVRKWERSFGCDVGVNSAAEAYTLHRRQRSLTACRFSEFIMNVLLFSSFSLTFLLSFTLFISPPFFLSSCHLPPLFIWSITPTLPSLLHSLPVTDSCSLSSWE